MIIKPTEFRRQKKRGDLQITDYIVGRHDELSTAERQGNRNILSLKYYL